MDRKMENEMETRIIWVQARGCAPYLDPRGTLHQALNSTNRTYPEQARNPKHPESSTIVRAIYGVLVRLG